MENSRLISGKGSRVVTLAEMAEVPTPPATYSWRPIPHTDFVFAIKETLCRKGFTVTAEKYALARNDSRLFGVIDLAGPDHDKHGMAVGFRHAHDKSLAASLVAGARVFVCDNLCLTGASTLLHHKHTWGWSLLKTLTFGMEELQTAYQNLEHGIYVMEETQVTDDRAKALILDASIAGVMPKHLIAPVYEWYFEKGKEQGDTHEAAIITQKLPYDLYPDVAPRTLYGLHNAFTRAFSMRHFAGEMECSQKLGKLFNI